MASRAKAKKGRVSAAKPKGAPRRAVAAAAESMLTAEEDPRLLSRLTLLSIVLLFSAYVFIFQSIVPGELVFTVLLLSSAVWFAFEIIVRKPTAKEVASAALAGAILTAIFFVYENAGTHFGLWTFEGRAVEFPLLNLGDFIAPTELLGACFIGGAAWYFYLPKKFEAWHSALDIFSFTVYGAVGEFVLQSAGLLLYHPGWGFTAAVASYFVICVTMHAVRYGVLDR